jgi:hypothetical protein
MMYKICNILSIGLVGLFLFACTSDSSNNAKNILELKRVGQIALDVDSTVGKLGMFYVYDRTNDCILTVDVTHQQIIVFDSEGNLIRKYGSEGAGPGEFRRIYSATFDDKLGVVAIDMSKNSVIWFNQSGELETEFEINPGYAISPHDLFYRDGLLYIPSFDYLFINEPDKSSVFLIYNKNGELIETKGFHQEYEFPIMFSTYVTSNYLSFYYIKKEMDIIYKKELNSNEIVSVTNQTPIWFNHLVENIAFGVTREEANQKSLGKSFSTLFINDHFVFHFYVNLTEEFLRYRSILDRENFLVLYDRELNYIGETKLDYPLIFVSNDYFYLLEDENPDNLVFGRYSFDFQ